MVKLTRIYTRGGDKGKTSLGNGARVEKHSIRVEAYGAVDETNAVIGVARLYTQIPGQSFEADAMLARIQNDLFDLGADLCTPPKPGEQDPEWALRIVQEQVDRLEREIDALNGPMKPLASFILPGGSPAAAHLHLARTTARRAERMITALAATEPDGVNPLAISYINRLSDHLFVLSRHMNNGGEADVLWTPGANR